MDETTTVGSVRYAADQHFSSQDKDTFLTYKDIELQDGDQLLGALEVPKISSSVTLVLQSKNDQELNFNGHSGKLWQCETCSDGFTVKGTFKRFHKLGRNKSHKLLTIFKQPASLGVSRNVGWGKPDETEDSHGKTSTLNTSKNRKTFEKEAVIQKSSENYKTVDSTDTTYNGEYF